ncbi:MAG: aldehyde dehydrogenase family protein [Streptosporangiaceae bacterium]
MGATRTARYIYACAAETGKRAQASGGAKNAVVIMPDADLDLHLPSIMNSLFSAAGQRCLACPAAEPVLGIATTSDQREPARQAAEGAQ